MKPILNAVALVALLCLCGCQNKDIDVETFSIADEQVWPGTDTVGIRGTYDFFMEAEGMRINIGTDSTLSDANSHAMALSDKDYAVTVRHLQPNTTYYYGYSVDLGLKHDFLTETRHFTTLALPPVQEYTVSVVANPTEGGTVSGGGTYTEGQTCAVLAAANEGYTFINWTENDSIVSLDSLYRFTVNADRALVAQFEMQIPEPEEYTITVSANPTDGGTVSGGGIYQEGQQCTVTATANEGFDFANWTENGNVVSTNASYSFTVTGNRTLVANFTAQPQNYTVTISANPTNGGTVTGGGTYQEGQQCTVTATANTGFDFANWTENGSVVSTNANYTFTVNSNRTLVANFTAQPQNYTIAVSANPSNAGTVSGGGTYQQGQQCTVTASANIGFEFTNWMENGNVFSTNTNYTFTVNSNRTLVANFTQQAPTNYTISVSANPSNGGTVTGGGTYQQGQSCTVHATANEGYTFTSWTENGNVVSTNANYTFTVNSNRTLVAEFVEQHPGWHTYCESEFNDAVGSTLTTTPKWGYEYPVSVIGGYAGFQMTKVSLFSDNLYNAVGGNYTCRIYVGGSQPEDGTMVSTITVDVPQGQNAWVDWDLTTPVSVSGTEPIWVIWQANTHVSNWPAGCCGDFNELGTWWDGGNGWDHLTYGTWTMRHWFTNREGRNAWISPSSDLTLPIKPQGYKAKNNDRIHLNNRKTAHSIRDYQP